MPVTEYVWDDVNDCVLEETDGTGATQVTYTHEPGPFGPLVSEYHGTTTYNHHYDALGSTRLLTDDAGAVTDTFTYDAWGNEVARTGTTNTAYTWIGRWGYQHDTPTGGYYIRARSYQPIVARWTSVDPLINTLFADLLHRRMRFFSKRSSSALVPYTMSNYSYSLVMPTVYQDPSGLLPIDPVFCGISEQLKEVSPWI